MSLYFSLEQSTLTLNGTTITGFSEDTDAIEIPSITLSEVRRGADGKMTAATTGDKGVDLSIKLLPTSDSVKFLSSIVEQQKRGARVVFNGSLVNHETGASLSLTNGVILEAPPFPSLGKGNTANMVYIIAFESATGNFEAANFL